MPIPRPLAIDDIIRVTGDRDLWKITAITSSSDEQHVTATSLNAYPRIDIHVPASRVTRAHQE